MQHNATFWGYEKKIFLMKICNTDFGNLLEPSVNGGSNDYLHLSFKYNIFKIYDFDQM